MKRISETFTNEEFENLKKAKRKKSWHDFIMELAEKPKSRGEKDE